MTTVPFEAWHLDLMTLPDKVRAAIGKYPTADILVGLAAVNLAVTMVSDEDEGPVKILGIAGAAPVKDGKTAEVFVLVAEGHATRSIAFVKAVRRVLDYAQGRFATIEALSGDGVPDRWFEWLGFAKCGSGQWCMAGRGEG